ncbi:hypothetical protein RclHR1_06410008 [Rhizophagus clarus]|uniref:Ribonuclease H-like domain-containing protein n=1 Tax=Rhizophagus clarus TaxID=94130 RepID=A0A2Z6RU58_9GLOM|nr:hypothetical protein RclHR1_06410008 [Rhizophagus clarus]GES87972.1 ribonuclease H-like domain-containing protein [Rhizophagus clarus]
MVLFMKCYWSFYPTHFKQSSLSFPQINRPRTKEWVYIWSPLFQQTVFGRIIEKFIPTSSVSIQHWIIDSSLSTFDLPVFSPCSGCSLNQFSLNIPCSFLAPIQFVLNIPLHKKISESKRQFNLPLCEFSSIAHLHYDFILGFNRFLIPVPSSISLPDNLLIRFIDSGHLRNQLLIFQNQFSSFSNFEFYTDGSVVDLSQETCSMTFAFSQTHPSTPLIHYSTSIENWPSSFKAELSAVVVALLLVPSHSSVIIHTDSQSIVERFNHLSALISLTPRYLLKGSSCNPLWIILFEILSISHISLSLIKIKAHSNDINNNFVDSLARSSHALDPLPVCFTLNFTLISCFPLWKSIPIELNVRQFITNLSRNSGFEKFLFLSRNNRYLILDVHWESTFFILSDDEDSSATFFSSSFRKAHKIKLLLQELPTVKHVKLRRPDLYNGWNCPVCKDHPETFAHIWRCRNHLSRLNTIIFNSKKHLISLVNQYRSINSSRFTNQHLRHPSLWNLDVQNDSFSFVDLIKGVVPCFLFNVIDPFVDNSTITLFILSVFIDSIYSSFMSSVWNPHCERMLLDEYHAGITRQSKRMNCVRSTSPPITRSSFSFVPTFFGVDKLINFGVIGYLFIQIFVYWLIVALLSFRNQ